jgi:hypothetical protein
MKDAGKGMKYTAEEGRSKDMKEIKNESNSIIPEKINC